MNLALFPVTALLLLLSGVGQHPCVPGVPGRTTALFQTLLSPGHGALPRTFRLSPQAHACLLLASGLLGTPRTASRPSAPLPFVLPRNTGDQPLRRSRFGTASAVYQPLGPPATRA